MQKDRDRIKKYLTIQPQRSLKCIPSHWSKKYIHRTSVQKWSAEVEVWKNFAENDMNMVVSIHIDNENCEHISTSIFFFIWISFFVHVCNIFISFISFDFILTYKIFRSINLKCNCIALFDSISLKQVTCSKHNHLQIITYIIQFYDMYLFKFILLTLLLHHSSCNNNSNLYLQIKNIIILPWNLCWFWLG